MATTSMFMLVLLALRDCTSESAEDVSVVEALKQSAGGSDQQQWSLQLEGWVIDLHFLR